jgi:beta-glucanase (GH16 family)
MKTLIIAFLFLAASASAQTVPGNTQKTKWKLMWQDNFKGKDLDTTKWNLISVSPGQRASDWNRHMINDPRVYSVKDGCLYLTAIKNPGVENDARPYLTGGVNSRNKFYFTYGKIEIRMKKECAQGAWPALWMLLQDRSPNGGEIDLMEHLNFDPNIHYNVHCRWVDALKNKSNPKSSNSEAKTDVTQWNVYGMEWHPDVLIWTLNGKETFRYPRLEKSQDPEQLQWPYDKPFYFILSQQLGGSWVGEVNPDQLPVSMIIDYVKVYQQR